MRFRPPSAGLLYLLLTATGAVVFFDYLTQPFFFELPPQSAENNLGEARYLMKLARQSSGRNTYRYLAEARKLAETHNDEALISEIIRMQNAPTGKKDPEGFVEVQPGVSLAGFDETGRVNGAAMGTVRLHNPMPIPLRVLLKFEAEGDTPGKFIIGDKTTSFAFSGDKSAKLGSFLTPAIGPQQTLDVQVGINAPSGSASKGSGLRYAGAEIRP